MDKIKEHYTELAHTFGESKEMSMEDHITRDFELKEILWCIGYFRWKQDNLNVLEVGCGNGYTANEISKYININYRGIDFCEDLVKIASDRKIKDYTFVVGDATKLPFDSCSSDIVFSERCLINLPSWESQKKSLSEIYRVLKPGGIYIMVECFTDGLNNLNEARRVVGLEPVVQKSFNKYFDKEYLMHYIKNKFVVYKHDCFNHSGNFLSSYYFGRSVLYPALSKNKLEYNNKFAEFFSYMKPYGNYSYIQSVVLERLV